MLNHSAVAPSSRAHLARLSNLHPGLLLANQMEETSDMVPLTDNGVGEVQQSCSNTLMTTVEWTDRTHIWRVQLGHIEPKVVVDPADVDELRGRLRPPDRGWFWEGRKRPAAAPVHICRCRSADHDPISVHAAVSPGPA
jgi:hypothetical protein